MPTEKRKCKEQQKSAGRGGLYALFHHPQSDSRVAANYTSRRARINCLFCDGGTAHRYLSTTARTPVQPCLTSDSLLFASLPLLTPDTLSPCQASYCSSSLARKKERHPCVHRPLLLVNPPEPEKISEEEKQRRDSGFIYLVAVRRELGCTSLQGRCLVRVVSR